MFWFLVCLFLHYCLNVSFGYKFHRSFVSYFFMLIFVSKIHIHFRSFCPLKHAGFHVRSGAFGAPASYVHHPYQYHLQKKASLHNIRTLVENINSPRKQANKRGVDETGLRIYVGRPTFHSYHKYILFSVWLSPPCTANRQTGSKILPAQTKKNTIGGLTVRSRVSPPFRSLPVIALSLSFSVPALHYMQFLVLATNFYSFPCTLLFLGSCFFILLRSTWSEIICLLGVFDFGYTIMPLLQCIPH